MIHRLFLHEYAWVYKRCLVSLVVPTTARKLVCQEAWSHMVANQDPALLWPDSLVSSYSVQERHSIDEAVENVRNQVAKGEEAPVTNVHFTLTSPLHVVEAQDLGLCSAEAVARFCQRPSSPCRLNIWVVDRAATEFANNDLDDNDVKDYLAKLVNAIQSTQDNGTMPPSYCIRVINKPASYDDTEYDSTLAERYTAGCPAPTARSRGAGKGMREWLGSQAAMKQIPEHSSDAWRLVALLEWGGLYMDLDVLPLSPLLFRIPKESVPVQHRVGAYRVNGGVLRLGDGLDDVNWATGSADDKRKRVEEGSALSSMIMGGGLRNRKTFLEALEADHLLWAPLLASQPLEEQKFGFLGPAALTRTLTSHAFSGNVTVLPKEVVEPREDQTLCTAWQEKRTLAIHFSGKKRKAQWRSIVAKTGCVRDIVHDICPHMM